MARSRKKRGRKSVLITGSSGYVGHLLTESLARDSGGPSTIVATDIRLPPASERLDGVEYLALDIRSPDLPRVLREHAVDAVVHLASVVTPPKGASREFLYSIDVEGTRNVLEACLEAKVGRLVVTSSGAAYGYHADNPPLLDEEDALRGNREFAYSHHKRLVEEMLAGARRDHPELEQVIFRVCTVLGESVSNQITALFEQRVVIGLMGAAAPFVFIWDRDLVRCLRRAIGDGPSGIYNVAADGTMTMKDIARALGRPYVPLPPRGVAAALAVLHRAGLVPYGPEQVNFLRYRPVLGNRRLKESFGYTPELSSRQVFDLYRRSHRHP